METVVSKINVISVIRFLAFEIFTLSFLIWPVVYATYPGVHYSFNQWLFIIIAYVVLFGFQINKIRLGIVRKITIDEDNIIVEYFIIKPLVVKHTDVKAIYTYSGASGRMGQASSYKGEDLELNNGDTIGLDNTQFENYNDLKQAIWNYRVLAFAKLNAENDAQG